MFAKLLFSFLVVFNAMVCLGQNSGLLDAPCTSNYFFKTYFNTVGVETLGISSVVTSNGDVFVCGEARTSPSDGFILKINSQGTVQWELSIGGPGSQIINALTLSIDGHLLVFGFDNGNGINSHFLAKVDTNGTILWRKDYQLSGNFSFGGNHIKQDADGSIYVVAYYLENNLSFNDRIVLLRFDDAGNLLLSTSYKPPNVTSILAASDFIIQNNCLYIIGYHSYQSTIQGLLLKVDKYDGAIKFTRTYKFNNNACNFFQVFTYEDDLYFLGSDNLNETDTSVLIRTDTSGVLKATNFFWYPNERGPGRASMDAGGSFIWSSYYRAGGPINLAITKVHPTDGVAWVKQYPQVPNIPRTQGIGQTADSSLFIIGYGNSRTFVGKFTKNGDYGCTVLPLPYVFGTGKASSITHSFKRNNLSFNPVNKTTVTSGPLLPNIDSICVRIITCDSLKLIAPPPLCRLTDTITVGMYTNNSCTLFPNFFYNQAQLRFISVSGNKVKFVPLMDGVFVLKAELSTGCATLKDSISLHVFSSPDSLDLGADKALCQGNSILLNAHKGFASYLWQDGSTDSAYTVTQQGLYYVTTTDACGGIFRDSVNISAAPPIPFNIGPDRTKCNNDTLHLSASTGFLKYAWSNNYNISSTASQNVVVNPLVDTAYFIKAEKTPGCFAYDTVRITVHHSPSINLGSDKELCRGDSAVFDAGAGFANFIWSTGARTQQVIVKETGNYSIAGTTAEGCKSFDTVRVPTVHPLPIVTLNKNPALCTGSEKLLDAGNFSSYNWSNGSTSKTIKINGVGVYSVNVTDAKGCKGTDTTIITTLHPLPAKFLSADTFICSYGTLQLKPLTNYNHYVWSTGSVNSSITITQPGHYWLEVTDSNLCMGRDSILVALKQCMEGFYIANAFTPNGDYKNDIMRPLLFGNVKSYRFTIYNRWGEIVFQTNELRKGWDGKFAGRLQQTGVFIWICNYQFEGAEDKTQKGTFTLIR